MVLISIFFKKNKILRKNVIHLKNICAKHVWELFAAFAQNTFENYLWHLRKTCLKIICGICANWSNYPQVTRDFYLRIAQ